MSFIPEAVVPAVEHARGVMPCGSHRTHCPTFVHKIATMRRASFYMHAYFTHGEHKAHSSTHGFTSTRNPDRSGHVIDTATRLGQNARPRLIWIPLSRIAVVLPTRRSEKTMIRHSVKLQLRLTPYTYSVRPLTLAYKERKA